MKIYINHFNLRILPELIQKLNKYYVKSEEYLQLFSEEGLYLIEEKTTFKLKPIDHNIIVMNNFYDNYTIIVDPSFFILEKAFQIPTKHIIKNIKREIFSNNNTSKITLVIETEKNKTNFDYHPTDIYFELANGTNIENTLIKKELIEFLCLLN